MLRRPAIIFLHSVLPHISAVVTISLLVVGGGGGNLPSRKACFVESYMLLSFIINVTAWRQDSDSPFTMDPLLQVE